MFWTIATFSMFLTSRSVFKKFWFLINTVLVSGYISLYEVESWSEMQEISHLWWKPKLHSCVLFFLFSSSSSSSSSYSSSIVHGPTSGLFLFLFRFRDMWCFPEHFVSPSPNPLPEGPDIQLYRKTMGNSDPSGVPLPVQTIFMSPLGNTVYYSLLMALILKICF